MREKEERLSYLMLFCAFILVRTSQASLVQVATILPLTPGARHLAGNLATHEDTLQALTASAL